MKWPWSKPEAVPLTFNEQLEWYGLNETLRELDQMSGELATLAHRLRLFLKRTEPNYVSGINKTPINQILKEMKHK